MIKDFTGLRAVAALLVIFAHVNFWTGYHLNQPFFYRCVTRLEFTVPIFFALSGYLLYRSWKKNREPSLTKTLWTYFVHRWWRIVPAYLIVVISVWWVSPWLISTHGKRPLWTDFSHYLWFGQNYWPHQQVHGLTHTWSSSIETGWYCIFPLIAILLTTLRNQVAKETEITVAILMTFLGVFIFSLQVWCSRYPIFADYRIVPWGFLAWFTIGIIINILPQTPPWLTITVAVVVCSCLLISPSTVFGPATNVDFHLGPAVRKYILYTIVAGGVIYLTRAGALKFLRWTVIVWLGELSYEIFLLHVPVMELLMKSLHWPTFTGSPFILYPLVIVISILLSWPLHKLCLQLPLWWNRIKIGSERILLSIIKRIMQNIPTTIATITTVTSTATPTTEPLTHTENINPHMIFIRNDKAHATESFTSQTIKLP